MGFVISKAKTIIGAYVFTPPNFGADWESGIDFTLVDVSSNALISTLNFPKLHIGRECYIENA